MTIRVLLADDHPTMREGLTKLLGAAADIEVVGAAADGQEAVALAAEHPADVILMDLQMPRLDGIEATRQIVASGCEAHVVILTSFSDRERIVEALDAGAIGYLLKDAEPDELLRGIRSAAAGRIAAGAEGRERRAARPARPRSAAGRADRSRA